MDTGSIVDVVATGLKICVKSIVSSIKYETR